MDNVTTMPPYILSGVVTIKSVNVIITIDNLIKDFNKEHNISQKEIYEVALIQFLKKYGYKN